MRQAALQQNFAPLITRREQIKGRLSEPPSVRGVTFSLRQLCQPNGLNFFSPTFKSRTVRPILKFGTFLKPSGIQHEWCSHTYRTICTLPEHGAFQQCAFRALGGPEGKSPERKRLGGGSERRPLIKSSYEIPLVVSASIWCQIAVYQISIRRAGR